MKKLLKNLNTILDEKTNKLLPENLKKGVTLLGVEGTMELGLDTSDATAKASDIISPKTAYVNGEKVTGTIQTEDITLESSVINNQIVFDTVVDTLYGLSHDRTYLFVCSDVQESSTSQKLSVYLLNENNNYDLVKSYSASELGITIGPYAFSVGKWGLFGDENKLLLTMKNNAYNSYLYGLVFDKSTNEILSTNINNVTKYNAYGFSHASPVQSDIFATQDGIYQYGESSVNKLWNSSYSNGWFNNFSCNGKLFTVTNSAGTTTKLVYINNNAVVKEATESKVICPNTTGNYAFVDGELKSFTINSSTGEYSYSDLDYTITTSKKQIIWIDSLVYGVIDDASTGENTFYTINFYQLNPEEGTTTAILSTKGLQNHDNTLRNLSSGNFGNGIITTLSNSVLEIIYVANNQLFTTTLTYKSNKYYSNYDATITSADVVKNKIGYNKDGKVIGSIMPISGDWQEDASSVSEQTSSDKLSVKVTMPIDYLFRKNTGIEILATNQEVAEAGNITADKIVKGNTIFGIEGTAEASSTDYNITASGIGTGGKALYTYITEIGNIDTSACTNMYNMFYNFSGLTTIPLLDTSKVTSADSMFYGCTSLSSLPLLDMSACVNMNNIFYNCISLTTIPLLDTSNVYTMNRMFQKCSNLETIPVLDTSNVTYMSGMFDGCTNLTDEGLNNILAMCTNATKMSSNKTLKYIGLTETQVEICTTLSNYEAFTTAGWTTGY